MSIDKRTTKELIEKEINNLLCDFNRFTDKYLTESDVKCALVNNLMKIKAFSELQETADNSKSIPIHSEVRWYGDSGKLRLISDIVIIDVKGLMTKERNNFKLYSKGYSFCIPIAIFEIKFRRINGESDNRFIKEIKQDIEKLKKIKIEIRGDYLIYLIVLDKKCNIINEINTLINTLNDDNSIINDISIYYIYANSNSETK